ncbi:DUF2750 domain-containing protein [Desulfovibrio sp. OttesenSCG-928-O18]|nr:DUF2750 domain-containing protein [Desulfovibrio sp. OttesenSCG-928-O18]
MHPEKMKNVLALNDQERLGYFIKKCADSGEVWGLRNEEGWCGMGTEDDAEAMPLWPEEAFAALLAVDDWAGCKPALIPLRDFLKHWLPGMDKDGVLAAVFPILNDSPSGMSAVAVRGEELKSLLLDECEQYGGLS